MQLYKKLFHKSIGPGGPSCSCCNPKFRRRTAARKAARQAYTQLTRSKLKQFDRKENNES